MGRTGSVLLEFNTKFNQGKEKELRDGLSVLVQVDHTLWVANDEGLSLERLTYLGDNAEGVPRYGNHEQFPLGRFIRLPAMSTIAKGIVEADLEGLAYDEANQYLWLTGSHSLKRKQVDKNRTAQKNFERLEKKSSDGNRFLLARIPMLKQHDTFTLTKVVEGENRTAAQLRGSQSGNALTEALSEDEHLRDFFAIPGKDNGFDIEGLAVAGNRLLIGLRGPVLRGWAIILEIEPQEEVDDPHTLKLGSIGPNGRPYRKHFIQLGGLGIRDLCVQGSDLLILAGPTMELDGPVTVSRWTNGAQPKEESLIFSETLTKVLDIPFGQDQKKGTDHAEGISLFSTDASPARSFLLVYDSVSNDRKQGDNAVEADIFVLPGAS